MKHKTLRVLMTGMVVTSLLALFATPAQASGPSPISSGSSAIDTLNYYRALAGEAAVSANPSYAQAATDHACYTVMYQEADHSEVPGAPTCTTDSSRNTAANNEAAFSVVSYNQDPSRSPYYHVSDFISAPFHGVEMLNPVLAETSVGYWQQSGKGSSLVMRVQGPTNPVGTQSGVYTFPANGTSDPLTSFSVSEDPDPLPACGYSGTVGAPIYIYLPAAASGTVVNKFQVNGTDIRSQVCEFDSTNFTNPNDSGATSIGRSILSSYKAIVLLPKSPLARGASYTYNVSSNGYSTGDVTFSVPASAPSAPTSLVATGTNGAINLRWGTPSDDGGATITKYTAILNPGNVTLTTDGSGRQVTFTGLNNSTTYSMSVYATNSVGDGQTASISGQPYKAPGYWIVDKNGTVRSYGTATWYGDMSGQHLNSPIVAATPTADGGGYWLLGGDGGIFSFGDAAFYGSTGNLKLNAPVVGMAATPDGKGYWLVAKDGGIFSYGDAQFFGSTGSLKLNAPVVDMSPSLSGNGYRFVATDGGVFCFGDAGFYGSTGSIHLNKPMYSLANTPSGGGYWLIAQDGGVFSYGDAQFFGSLPGIQGAGDGLRIRSTADGGGYYILGTTGKVFGFGNATTVGDASGTTPADLMLVP